MINKIAFFSEDVKDFIFSNNTFNEIDSINLSFSFEFVVQLEENTILFSDEFLALHLSNSYD